MDTDEGDHEEPQSLHKYLYCQGDPVDGEDQVVTLHHSVVLILLLLAGRFTNNRSELC